MTEHLILEGAAPDGGPITVIVRRSARARRLSLRVSGLDGRATLSLPLRVDLRVARAFLDEKADWIAKQLKDQPPRLVPEPGAMFEFQGQKVRIETKKGAHGLTLSGGVLEVPQWRDRFARRLGASLREVARAQLALASDRHAATLGQPYRKLTLRDPRSRWGSCSSNGDLMYSWRLIMAPDDVLDYVAAHEVAHLREMNHSPAFWKVVEYLAPDHGKARAWLRAHGAELHRWQFD